MPIYTPDRDNQKDCTDGEEDMNNKQHAATLEEITNIVVHIEMTKSWKLKALGFLNLQEK